MNDFDELWADAARHVRPTLDRTLRPAQVQATVKALRTTNFPGALALMALGERKGDREPIAGLPFLRAIAEGAAVHPRARATGLDADRIEQLLRALLVDRTGTDKQGLDDDMLADLLSAGAERAGVPVRPQEATRIVRLLTSGEFFGDVESTTAVVFASIPKLPLAVVRDFAKVESHPPSLIRAVARDLDILAPDMPRLLIDLRDGRLDKPPGVLTHTMRQLYALSSIATIAETIRTLIDPSNESVRLAIVIYARANGIPIEEADLDLLRTSVLNTDDPTLGPAVAAAIGRLQKRYGNADLERVLGQLAA